MKLRCYCCGCEINPGESFLLVNFGDESTPADRVMIFRNACERRLESQQARDLVFRVPTKETEMDRPYQQHSDTSVEAAATMKDSAPTLRAKVLDFVIRVGGATDEEVQNALDMPANTQRPRRRELQLDGKIVDSGIKRPTRSGRSAVVWYAA